jgi:hypothetical protein
LNATGAFCSSTVQKANWEVGFNRNEASDRRNAREMISDQSATRTTNNRKPTSEQEIEMNTFKPIYTLAIASVFAGVLAGCADFRASEPPKDSPDAKITADVQAQLNQMAYLGPPGSISVQTVDNVVYLNGLVEGGLAKRNAESVVRQVPGVQQVVDDIDVQHGD